MNEIRLEWNGMVWIGLNMLFTDSIGRSGRVKDGNYRKGGRIEVFSSLEI